jgi:hypothetical protein
MKNWANPKGKADMGSEGSCAFAAYKPATKLAQISERPNASLNAYSNVYPHILGNLHLPISGKGVNDATTG